MKKILGLVLMMGLMTSASASAGVKFSIAGGANYMLNKVTVDMAPLGSSETKGGLSYGGGALIGFGMGQAAEFELGALYMKLKLTTSATAADGTAIDLTALNPSFNPDMTEKVLLVPATFLFHLGKAVSLGLGGYYGASLETDGGSDYGAKGGLRFHFSPNVFFDAAYWMGLKKDETITNPDLQKTKFATALLGISFGGK